MHMALHGQQTLAMRSRFSHLTCNLTLACSRAQQVEMPQWALVVLCIAAGSYRCSVWETSSCNQKLVEPYGDVKATSLKQLTGANDNA